MTEASVQEVEDVRREPETLEEQASAPKGKGAARKRKAHPPSEKPKPVDPIDAHQVPAGEPLPNGKAVVPGKQTRIEGTHDPVPQEVKDLAQRYEETLRMRMSLQTEENSLKPKLMDAMKKHDIIEIETDDSIITYEHVDKEKITCKKKADDE